MGDAKTSWRTPWPPRGRASGGRGPLVLVSEEAAAAAAVAGAAPPPPYSPPPPFLSFAAAAAAAAAELAAAIARGTEELLSLSAPLRHATTASA